MLATSSGVEIITQKQFITLLKEIDYTTIVSMVVNTEPQLKAPKSNPLTGRIKKLSYINGMIGNWDYTNAVNNRLEKENKPTDFKAQPRKWGVHIDGTPFIVHNNNYYVEIRLLNVYQTKYMVDGIEVMKDDILDNLTKQSNSSRQGTTNEVIVRTYKLDSIKSLRYNRRTYQII